MNKPTYDELLVMLDRIHGLLDSEVSSEFIYNELFNEIGVLIARARGDVE